MNLAMVCKFILQLPWLVVLFSGPWGRACTVLQISNADEVTVAKNLDWHSGYGMVFINKRNMTKKAIFVGGQQPLTWTSNFMSLTLTQTGRDFPWGGMNERGLSVEALQLGGSKVSPVDQRPAVGMTQWMQYLLDTADNTSTAIARARAIRVALETTIHYFVCDAEAKCAVFEYLEGSLVIRSADTLPIAALTNNTYEKSLGFFNRSRTQLTPKEILSGKGVSSLERFSRAAVWSREPPRGSNPVQYAFSALENLSQSTKNWRTYWKTVSDLKARTVVVSTLASPEKKTIHLLQFDPSCKSGTLMLDLNLQTQGIVDSKFLPFTSQANEDLVEQADHLSDADKILVKKYPEENTNCLD